MTIAAGAASPDAFTRAFADFETTVIKTVSKQDAEIKKHGAVSAATKKELESINARYQELAGQYGELKGRFDQLSLKLGRPAVAMSPGLSKMLGQDAQLQAQANARKNASQFLFDQIKSWYDDENVRKVLLETPHHGLQGRTFEAKAAQSGNSNRYSSLARKAALGDFTSGGLDALRLIAMGERVQELMYKPAEGAQVLDLFPTSRTSSDTVYFTREKNFAAMHASITSTASAGQAQVEVANVTGFYVGQPVTLQRDLSNGTSVVETGTVASIDEDTKTLTLESELANSFPAGTTAIPCYVWSVKYGTAPYTSIKPRSKFDVEASSTPVVTMASLLELPRQIFMDYEQVQATVQLRMVQAMLRSLTRQVLFGSGAANNMLGLFTNPDTGSYTQLSGQTIIDAMRKARTVARLSQYEVDAAILSPTDWETVELTKDEFGRYLFGSISDGAQPRLWRMRVVESTDMPAGQALVGAFGLGAMLWDREAPGVQVFEQNKDNVETNMITMRAEQRAAFTTYRPEAFVKVTLLEDGESA